MIEQEIKVIRLGTSEDIISFVKENEDGTITLNYPLNIFIDFDVRSKQQCLRLNFWLPINLIEETSITLQKSDVRLKLTPTKEFEEYYLNFLNDVEVEDEFDKKSIKDILTKLDLKHANKLH